eukprot:8066272-Pyramimonas_sp.AAC.1
MRESLDDNMMHERSLQWHAIDMVASVVRRRVIAGCRRALRGMQIAVRQRRATHVAAWVALCPRESPWLFDG